MNVLLIGSGGREHALAWALSQSPRLTTLYTTPGNAGIDEVATCVTLNVTDHAAVVAFCRAHAVDLVIVGPEAPLVAGLVDDLKVADIPVFGASREAAALEGSKGFTKDLCAEFNIPTAAYKRFSDVTAASEYVRAQGAPIVVKADGLAAGKGVVVATTVEDALAAVEMCFEGGFGSAGAEVVIEDCLVGEEASFFAICDGETALPLATAQDHKRVGDGDVGPNTGGMGAYSPAPVMTDQMISRTMDEIILPTVNAMKSRGMPFVGILFAGLMITENGPQLIEHNVRFGDPECQVLMMRLKSDLLDLITAAAHGQLAGKEVAWSDAVALTVVLAAKGYPGSYEKNTEIQGLEDAQSDEAVRVFHAGTMRGEDGTLRATGGRVLNVTALGSSVSEAKTRAYAAVDRINWPNGFCRRDIGWRAVEREEAE